MYLQNIISLKNLTIEPNIKDGSTITFSITQDTTTVSIKYGDKEIIFINSNAGANAAKTSYFPQSPIVDLKFIGKGQHKISDIALESERQKTK